jgi:NADH-quinone oxidoreductase subunit M
VPEPLASRGTGAKEFPILYRFVLPMVPEAVLEYAPAIAVVSIIGILYAGLVCWLQDDLKRLVAYSSVSHLGFCVLGLVALNPLGAQGSVLYMINHGLSTGALFFLVGMIYERYHSRDMAEIGGLARRMPVWGFFTLFFVLSSVGLPGLNGFVSEFLCLVGRYAAVAAAGMLVAAHMLVGKVVFGPLREPAAAEHSGGSLPSDLSFREIAILVPLAVLCLAIGVQRWSWCRSSPTRCCRTGRVRSFQSAHSRARRWPRAGNRELSLVACQGGTGHDPQGSGPPRG